jgi:diacylglycerol kinase
MNTEQGRGFRSLGRIYKALIYSLDGLRHAATKEAAFQQELIVLAVLSALCIMLPFSGYLKI